MWDNRASFSGRRTSINVWRNRSWKHSGFSVNRKWKCAFHMHSGSFLLSFKKKKTFTKKACGPANTAPLFNGVECGSSFRVRGSAVFRSSRLFLWRQESFKVVTTRKIHPGSTGSGRLSAPSCNFLFLSTHRFAWNFCFPQNSQWHRTLRNCPTNQHLLTKYSFFCRKFFHKREIAENTS